MAEQRTHRFAIVEKTGPVTTVTLNRPEVLNALHREAHEELGRIFDDFADDPEQWVAIVTGFGRAFCAGYDLKAISAGEVEGWGPSGFGGLTRRFDCNKPLIAAVNGLALGGGFELALACDVVVATRGASFALPEVLSGLVPASGGLQRLPLQIGPKRAMGMILTGKRISAAEACAFGFVNEVVEDGGLLRAAQRWAGEICRCSPLALQASKAAVMQVLDAAAMAIRDQSDLPAVRRLQASQDFVEGPRAFAQKRRPVWKGC